MVTAGQVLSFSPLGWGKLSTQGFLKNILKKMAVQDENGSIYVFTPSSGEKLWKKDIDLQFEAKYFELNIIAGQKASTHTLKLYKFIAIANVAGAYLFIQLRDVQDCLTCESAVFCFSCICYQQQQHEEQQ